jgi:hypothetical protein
LHVLERARGPVLFGLSVLSRESSLILVPPIPRVNYKLRRAARRQGPETPDAAKR